MAQPRVETVLTVTRQEKAPSTERPIVQDFVFNEEIIDMTHFRWVKNAFCIIKTEAPLPVLRAIGEAKIEVYLRYLNHPDTLKPVVGKPTLTATGMFELILEAMPQPAKRKDWKLEAQKPNPYLYRQDKFHDIFRERFMAVWKRQQICLPSLADLDYLAERASRHPPPPKAWNENDSMEALMSRLEYHLGDPKHKLYASKVMLLRSFLCEINYRYMEYKFQALFSLETPHRPNVAVCIGAFLCLLVTQRCNGLVRKIAAKSGPATYEMYTLKSAGLEGL